jgi:hypothetical protein
LSVVHSAGDAPLACAFPPHLKIATHHLLSFALVAGRDGDREDAPGESHVATYLDLEILNLDFRIESSEDVPNAALGIGL